MQVDVWLPTRADKQDISNFQWWMLIFNYEMPCRSTATPGPIRQVIQARCSL